MVLKSASMNLHQLLGKCSKTKHLHRFGGALWFVVQGNPLQEQLKEAVEPSAGIIDFSQVFSSKCVQV